LEGRLSLPPLSLSLSLSLCENSQGSVSLHSTMRLVFALGACLGPEGRERQGEI